MGVGRCTQPLREERNATQERRACAGAASDVMHQLVMMPSLKHLNKKTLVDVCINDIARRRENHVCTQNIYRGDYFALHIVIFLFTLLLSNMYTGIHCQYEMGFHVLLRMFITLTLTFMHPLIILICFLNIIIVWIPSQPTTHCRTRYAEIE